MGVYIKLFHGRTDPGQDMEDWVFEGPTLGPFDSIHGIYATHLRCLTDGDQALELAYHEDMLVHDGNFYGDFAITSEVKQ